MLNLIKSTALAMLLAIPSVAFENDNDVYCADITSYPDATGEVVRSISIQLSGGEKSEYTNELAAAEKIMKGNTHFDPDAAVQNALEFVIQIVNSEVDITDRNICNVRYNSHRKEQLELVGCPIQ